MRRIPRFRLDPVPVDEDAIRLRRSEWLAPEVGTRHQLGGSPEELPEDAFPSCRSCGNRMTFYGQLDSINQDILIADAGIVMVFICFDCFEAQAVIESP